MIKRLAYSIKIHLPEIFPEITYAGGVAVFANKDVAFIDYATLASEGRV